MSKTPGLDIRMNRILALKASEEHPNWWVFLSFADQPDKPDWPPVPRVSFAVVYEDYACEWMVPSGPFMMWYRGDELDCHIFGRALDIPMAWSQLAASKHVHKLVPGGFASIFGHLEMFAESNERPYIEEDEDEGSE